MVFFVDFSNITITSYTTIPKTRQAGVASSVELSYPGVIFEVVLEVILKLT